AKNKSGVGGGVTGGPCEGERGEERRTAARGDSGWWGGRRGGKQEEAERPGVRVVVGGPMGR
ncbi:hypothetical protein KI387_041363, partial [Taxus chinensis]